jgi:N-acetylneuraminic acid mutarotase
MRATNEIPGSVVAIGTGRALPAVLFGLLMALSGCAADSSGGGGGGGSSDPAPDGGRPDATGPLIDAFTGDFSRPDAAAPVVDAEVLVCSEDMRRCGEGVVEVCRANTWLELAACPAGTRCDAGNCVPEDCAAACEGRECGADGCGGVCGECAGGEICGADGQCAAGPSVCGDDECAADEACGDCAADCGDCCGDGLCDAPGGENCASCQADCGCAVGDVCDAVTRQCGACAPQCTGRICGDDGCGGVCGVCEAGTPCVDGRCEAACEPACAGRTCGADGCGGTCGACAGEQVCDGSGRCANPPDSCGDGVCEAARGEDCAVCARDCGDCCGDGTCDGAAGETCLTCDDDCGCVNNEVCDAAARCVAPCVAQCQGRDCGDDGCGGQCGLCADAQACVAGVCRDLCQPQCDGRTCGGDGCGGNCGACDPGLLCVDGACVVPCAPACEGKLCGPDGCGGFCGVCAEGTFCNDRGGCDPVCTPDCTDRACGDDGCGGRCGECDDGFLCTDGGACVRDAQACRCDVDEICLDGVCRARDLQCAPEQPAGLCPAGELCTGGACVDQGLGCGPRNPSGVCAVGELCLNGECRLLDAVALCDDGFQCTSEVFDFERNRCLYELRDGGCDDGNSCTEDRCVGGECIGAPIPGCVEPPRIDPYTSPTNNGVLVLAGDKPGGAALLVDAEEAVPANPELRWTITLNLAPGENLYRLSTDQNGTRSGTVEVRVVYDVTPPRIDVSPAAGTYAAGVTVTVTSDEPALVQYTDDGGTPDEWSPSFRSVKRFRIFEDTTLKFRARDVAGNVTGQIVTHTFRVTTAGNGWAQQPDLPVPLALAGVASVGGDVYVVGGTSGQAAQTTVLRRDAASGEWVEAAPLPSPRAELAATTASGVLYAIGGQDDGIPLNQVTRLQPGQAAWQARSPMPSTRFGLAAVGVDTRIYTFGGKTNGGAVVTNFEVYDTGSDSWSNQVVQMPRSRYAHAAVEHQGRIYLLGGEDAAGRPIPEVDVYVIAQNRWEQIADLPTPRSYLGAARNVNLGAVSGGFTGLLVAGGRTLGGAPSAVVEEYLLPDAQWVTRRSLPGAVHSLGAAAVPVASVYDQQETGVFVVGGLRDGDVVGAVSRYTHNQDYLRPLPDMPTGRFMHAAQVLDGRIWLFGGRDFQEVRETWIFDPETETYAVGPELPAVQNGLTSVVFDDEIYAIGGANQFGVALPTVRRFDAETAQWVNLAPMPTGRRDAAAAVLGGLIYVVGGDNNGAVQTVEIYDPASNQWAPGPLLPAGRRGARAFARDGALYVVGGIGPAGTVFAPVLRLQGNGWVQVADGLPVAYGQVQQIHDDQLGIFGGFNANAINDRVFSYNLALNGPSRGFTEATNLFPAIDRAAVAYLYGRVYVFGGNTNAAEPGPQGETRAYKAEGSCFNGILDGREVASQRAPFDLGGICPVEPPLVEYDLRLSGNAGPGVQARLEIYAQGQWGSICDDLFDGTDGNVACRQLFGPGSSMVTFTSGDIGLGGPIWLDDLGCNGGEARLIDCGHLPLGSHNCSHGEDVLITCR